MMLGMAMDSGHSAVDFRRERLRVRYDCIRVPVQTPTVPA